MTRGRKRTGAAGCRWFVLAICCAGLLLTSRKLWAQEIAYSTADRATVRVITVKGVDMIDERINDENMRIAVANAGHGSGVMISRDGLVATAYHVVKGANHIVVTKLNDATPYVARILAASPQRDIAILSVGGIHEDFIPVPRTSAPLRARQTVFAIGYPLDMARTDPQSSRGIVSGADPSGQLQLNMSINPGNSGGPILDEQDHLVGIARATRKDAEGIAYVVPVAAVRDLLEGVSAEARAAVRKALESTAQTDPLLGRLVVSFAEQVHLLGGIWEAMDRDHLSSMRALIETILSTHRDAPDVLALVAGYFWNEALVLRSRGQGGWQARQHRAVSVCKIAYGLDVDVDQRSPFVADVLALQAAAPATVASNIAAPRASAVASNPFPAGGSGRAQKVLPPASSKSTSARQASTPLAQLGGFQLGWQKTQVAAACQRAGHSFSTVGDSYQCSGAAEDLPYGASVELQTCPETVCQIAVRAPLPAAPGKEWLDRLGGIKNEYDSRYGRASRDVEVPRRCRADLLPCLADGSARLEYRWDVGIKTLSVSVGRRGDTPEMTISLGCNTCGAR
jgi:trypsin-like peptidase